MRILLIAFLIICSACNDKSEEQTLLYNQVLNYRDELKMAIKSQEAYLYEATSDNELYKKRFDSLNKINTELAESFERLRYGNRKAVLKLRDDYNSKYMLNMQFDSIITYESISDSIFSRLIETDILRLRKDFQDRYMFRHGCKSH
nr:hypothetical protein [uncultured Flavobacterium sp.]